ncbi:flavoprotein [Chloroflexota bacterium]
MKDKNILLGVTGSISAYKAADLASKLFQAGANVKVVMTPYATEFIPPLSFRAVTKNEVFTDDFASTVNKGITHVNLGDKADVVVIAPATANTIAKIAYGLADNILTATVLATTAPVVIAPAMHTNMYLNPATQENIAKLKARGYIMVGPDSGPLASGGSGPGRLTEISKIIEAIEEVLEKK